LSEQTVAEGSGAQPYFNPEFGTSVTQVCDSEQKWSLPQVFTAATAEKMVAMSFILAE
jgi:hypothetical protein